MHVSRMSTCFSALVIPTILFSPQSYAAAQALACPPASSIVYSPFVPVSQSSYRNWTGGTDNGCWWWATCVLAEADEPRKLQFASVALVMGLIPLTLKDLAWPERRVVAVSQDLPSVADTLVRALGIVPSVVGPTAARHAFSSSRMYRWAYSHFLPWQRALVAAGTLGLLLLYAAMAVVELYSKRSALGCVYPATILSWHVAALIPAASTTLFRHRTHDVPLDPAAKVQLSVTLGPEDEEVMLADSGANSSDSINLSGKTEPPRVQRSLSEPLQKVAAHEAGRSRPSVAQLSRTSNPKRQGVSPAVSAAQKKLHSPMVQSTVQQYHNDDISAVHGRGMLWIVPLMWAVYYVAGTLVYSSIMAVTVIELFIWVVVSFTVAILSKILALLICTLFENR